MVNVSVIVPVYNAEKYIIRCVESILGWDADPCIELILVEDGSEDNSFEICKKYSEKDKRVKFISQENSGPSVARNKGIEMAMGEYIMFVDADDYIECRCIHEMYNKAIENKADVVIASYILEDIKGNQKIIKQDFGETCLMGNEIFEQIALLYVGKSQRNANGLYSLWNKIYRRDFLLSQGIALNPNKKHGEDWLFNLECYLRCSKVSFVEKAYYHYVKYNTTGNLSNRVYDYNTFRASLYSHNYVKDKFRRRGYSEFDVFEQRFIDEVYGGILMLRIFKGDKAYLEIKRILSDEDFFKILEFDKNKFKPNTLLLLKNHSVLGKLFFELIVFYHLIVMGVKRQVKRILGRV